MSDQLLGVLVGGAVTGSVSVLLFIVTQWRGRGEWRRQAQLEASREVISALQQFNREITNLAISPARSVDGDTHIYVELHRATTVWNTARYRAALISPRDLVEDADSIDMELDKLLDLAAAGQWTASAFRSERVELGRLGAEYVRRSRSSAGEGRIEWTSLWTWHDNIRPTTRGQD